MEAVYSATIMVTTALREDYGYRIETVKSFLIRNEVDPVLRKRFITYLQLCWHTDKAYKMTHKTATTIFYDLPPHVFQDIVGRNRSNYIMAIPFMKLLKKDYISTISSRAKLFYTSPNEILLNTGDLTNEIYIIKRGICEIIDPTTHKSIGQLGKKEHFGVIICLLRLPSYYTYRAITHVQMFSIPRRDLMKAMETPQIKQAIDHLKKTREFFRLQKPLPSFMKYVSPPPTPNMMHFRLPRKHEPDTEFLHPFTRLGFLSILRYIFPRYTIRPDGKYLLRYEWFRVTCALLSAQLFPHYTYLVLQWPFLYYVALFLDISAWFDIVQRMMIGYFNEDGILVYHPAITAAYYIKGAFLADVFGCLSLENLETARKDVLENKFRVTPTKQFLMLNRMIQLYRMPSAMKSLKDHIERRDILMVIIAFPIFMAIVNVVTCFMVFFSVTILYSVDDYGNYDWDIEPFRDKGGSWLNLFSDAFRFNMTSTPFNLHLATYFWVVYECSTTGFGIFQPSNHELMKVLFIGMFSSTMIITYFSVRIISIRANVNNSLAGFQQHMKDINVYLAREKIDTELQKELRTYFEYNWEKMGGIDYRRVLKLCDQITLRTDAILHIYGPTFTQCPLLADCDVSLLRTLGRAVRSVYFLRGMKIIEDDDMVTDMYFVDYGGVEVRISMNDNCSAIRLPRGSLFGNLEGNESHRSPYGVVAVSRLHLLMINSLAFSAILKDFPAVKQLMAKLRTTGDKKVCGDMYILGGDAQVKVRRNAPSSGQASQNKTSVLKYIYFQEGFIQIYLISVCMGCIYLDMYNAGYQDNSSWLLITLYTLDFCFLLKILTQHCLPLVVPNKNIRKLLLPIRRMYFKKEFRYDLISVLPIELLSFATSNFWLWFAWLRLNRTFRIATVYKCLTRRIESITVNLTLTTVMAVSIWFTLFVHACTCMFYFVGMMEDAREPNSSWMWTNDGGSQCNNHYLCCMYFIIMTFTQNGVGDIMPKTHSEVIFISILMIVSTMVFIVYVGEFSNIFQFKSYRSFSFYSKYLELQEFLKNNRVSKNLVTIVNKYTLHLWRETRGLQIPHFLKHAPLSLRLRIMSAAYLHHITRHHIFEECEPAFLRQLVGCVKLYTYNAGMYVVKESEITESMYIIHNGNVKETCEERDIYSARVYPAGSCFGILQGLMRNTPYTHSYQTMIKSQVLTLHLDDWEYLLKHFPDSRKAIHKHMRQVGDDTDHSNWPGGAPEPERPLFEPISESIDLPPGMAGFENYPGIERRFGRDSHTEEAEDHSSVGRSSIKRQSRAFAWPTDNSEEKEEHSKTGQREPDEVREEEAALEKGHKKGFLAKITNTARKVMGKVSDVDALSVVSGEGKDELFLEEDEEATEALLKQFEEAQKMAQKDAKKNLRARRPTVFHPLEEEQTEKHMLTPDMNESQTSQIEETSSQRLFLRSIEIRDSDDASYKNVVNLGRKNKVNEEPSGSSRISTVNFTPSRTSRVNTISIETTSSTKTETIGGTTATIADINTTDTTLLTTSSKANTANTDITLFTESKADTEITNITPGTVSRKPDTESKPEKETTDGKVTTGEDATETKIDEKTTGKKVTEKTIEKLVRIYQAPEGIQETKPVVVESDQATKVIHDIEPAQDTSIPYDPSGQPTHSTSLPEIKLLKFYSDTSVAEDPAIQASQSIPFTLPTTTSMPPGTAATTPPSTLPVEEAESKGALSRKPLIFDPERSSPGTSNLLSEETKMHQFLSDAVHTADGTGKPPDVTLSSLHIETLRSAASHTAALKDENTNTSASKLNRRFVKVRYEEHDEDERSEDFEEEEDEKVDPNVKKHLDILNLAGDPYIARRTEGDDGQATTTSSSTATSSESENSNEPRKKPEHRKQSD